ncbi:hypothetical protein BJX61DRAFT_499462 [Aspergillus egyptiacus]|nr:hypothetical protein BJX61DRAFT_499462 [Aspergillus egyptiacus]
MLFNPKFLLLLLFCKVKRQLLLVLIRFLSIFLGLLLPYSRTAHLKQSSCQALSIRGTSSYFLEREALLRSDISSCWKLSCRNTVNSRCPVELLY